MKRDGHKLNWAVAGAAALLAFTGCASSKPKAAATFERPWIGGVYKAVGTPKAARMDGRHYARWGVLVTEAPAETPLHNAGIGPSDLIVAVNGKNTRGPRDLVEALKTTEPLELTVYRNGEFIEKTVYPGVERYQKNRTIEFKIGLFANYEIDLWPNPDFSLIAIGYKEDKKRLDLHGAQGRYEAERRAREHKDAASESERGLASDERWRVWLGPISWAENKVVLSQNAASAK